MSNRICIACRAENPADYDFCFHCNALSDDVPTVRNVTEAASKTKKKSTKKKSAKR